MGSLPDSVKAKLISQINADPGLPVESPTVSAWQIPPHALSEIRSQSLQQVVDFAIIGSGITGCSTAKTLLEHSGQSVTVFEARTLCSGATGRNGGHLVTSMPKEFKGVVARDGIDAAIQLARYSNRTVAKVAELAFSEQTNSGLSSEIRNVKEIMAFADLRSFVEALTSIQMYEDFVTEEKASHNVILAERAKALFHLNECVAVVSTKGCAIWPYRFVTNIWQQLYDSYPERLRIETQTPVVSVAYEPDNEYPYLVMTTRGMVRARQIFHCANAWTGHLLAGLRGKIFPLRATMNCQKSGSQFPNMGSRCLWLFYKTPKYESEPETFDGKLFYMHQNAVTGNIFCGGDKRRLDEIFTSDDGTMSTIAKDNLSSFIAKRFEPPWGGPNAEDDEMLHRWSGIIGLTPDGFPFVGKALQGVSGRMGNGEWIAAGYNGYGMSQSWSCGEAIARMALGEPLPPWFPSVCLMNEERLGDEDRMGSEAFLSRLFDTNPEFVKR